MSTIAAFALFHSTANALNECMATLKDLHGSVVVSCDGDTKATLKGGEHFLAERLPNGWSVYLKSGCDGFIEKADLQLLPNEPLMKLKFRSGKDGVAKTAIGSWSAGRGGHCLQRPRT